jgi:hypothetical protein
MATEAIDRAASLGGYGRDGRDVDEKTAEKYLWLWGMFEQWCRREGFTAMPATSETLALFVQALVQDRGYSRETARVACNAVRWKHRKERSHRRKDGRPIDPPDRRDAWFVLRYDHRMPPRFDLGPIRPACRDDLIEVARVCDLTTPAGVRDLLVVMLVYALGAAPAELAELRLRHVQLAAGGATVALSNRSVRLATDSWHTDRGITDAAPVVAVGDYTPAVLAGTVALGAKTVQADMLLACPVCLLWRWTTWLTRAGVAGGGVRLLRAVDKGGNVAGGARFAGSARDGMEEGALRKLIRVVTLRAELDQAVTRRPVTALRLGGALEARDRGADRAEVAAHAGYAPDSGTLARYLALPA